MRDCLVHVWRLLGLIWNARMGVRRHLGGIVGLSRQSALRRDCFLVMPAKQWPPSSAMSVSFVGDGVPDEVAAESVIVREQRRLYIPLFYFQCSHVLPDRLHLSSLLVSIAYYCNIT